MFNLIKLGWIPLCLMVFTQSVMASYDQKSLGSMAIANRSDGTVSIIGVKSDKVERTIHLPQKSQDKKPEPMYVVYKENLVYVGDRANNQVVVYDSHEFKWIKTIPVGKGVFHMWAAKIAQLLLVVGDIDNTISVIDTNSLEVKATVPIPQDLAQAGFKPHDVFISANGREWYVSLVGGSGQDWVIKYDYWFGRAYETARRQVGGDPHLFLVNKDRSLLVASQDGSSVTELDTMYLKLKLQTYVPNAHGIFSHYQRTYVTDIADGGKNGLYTLKTRNLRVEYTNNTPYPTPHNISVTNNGEKLYITHSGPTQDKVSVFYTHVPWAQPELKASVTVGLNPFGLAYIPH